MLAMLASEANASGFEHDVSITQIIEISIERAHIVLLF
jgi:hypothetical protein